jgi:ATP-dependent DNA helicase HFM1/MER3
MHDGLLHASQDFELPGHCKHEHLAAAVQLPISTVRLIAISATVRNVDDVAEWLRAPPQGLKAFGEELRPVKLTTIVKGYQPTTNDYMFERRLSDHLAGVIAEHSKGKPTLVFCRQGSPSLLASCLHRFIVHVSQQCATMHARLVVWQLVRDTIALQMLVISSRCRPLEHLCQHCEVRRRLRSSRKGTEETAALLLKAGRSYVRGGAQRGALQAAAARAASRALGQALLGGVGFHHGNLEPGDRAAVERLFLDRALLVRLPLTSAVPTCIQPVKHASANLISPV